MKDIPKENTTKSRELVQRNITHRKLCGRAATYGGHDYFPYFARSGNATSGSCGTTGHIVVVAWVLGRGENEVWVVCGEGMRGGKEEGEVLQ